MYHSASRQEVVYILPLFLVIPVKLRGETIHHWRLRLRYPPPPLPKKIIRFKKYFRLRSCLVVIATKSTFFCFFGMAVLGCGLLHAFLQPGDPQRQIRQIVAHPQRLETIYHSWSSRTRVSIWRYGTSSLTLVEFNPLMLKSYFWNCRLGLWHFWQ